MSIYYFTISVLTGLGYILAEKKKGFDTTRIYLAAAFLGLTFLASFRYAIGFDYFSYQSIYETMSAWKFTDIIHYYWYEPLFFISCKIFSLFGCPYPVFLLCINSFLMFAAMWFIYHNSKIPWLSVYLYITLQFLAYDMNLIRQSVAIAFFMLAYPYLKNKRLVPFTIVLFLGGLFHNSLWFMWPLYLLLHKKHTGKFLGSLIALTLLCYVFFDPLFDILRPILPVKYANYQGSYFWSSNSFDYVVPSALYGILICLFRNRIAGAVSRRICLNSALYHFLISLFITKHFILERFSVYPFVVSLIAIPEIVSSYQSDGQSRQAQDEDGQGRQAQDEDGQGRQVRDGEPMAAYPFVLLLFLLFGGAYFLFAAAKGFHHVYPYVSLLDRSISMPGR